MNLPEPGRYRVVQDVENPLGDRRYKVSYELAKIPLWNKGMVINVAKSHIAPDGVEAFTKFRHCGILMTPHTKDTDPSGVRWAALEPHLEKLPVGVKELLVVENMEHWYSPILQRLVDEGKVTLEDVSAAFKAEYFKDD